MTYCDCGDYCAWCRPDLCVPNRKPVTMPSFLPGSDTSWLKQRFMAVKRTARYYRNRPTPSWAVAPSRFDPWAVSVNRTASGLSRLSITRIATSLTGRRFVMRASADGLTFLRDADALAFAVSRGYVPDIHA